MKYFSSEISVRICDLNPPAHQITMNQGINNLPLYTYPLTLFAIL